MNYGSSLVLLALSAAVGAASSAAAGVSSAAGSSAGASAASSAAGSAAAGSAADSTAAAASSVGSAAGSDAAGMEAFRLTHGPNDPKRGLNLSLHSLVGVQPKEDHLKEHPSSSTAVAPSARLARLASLASLGKPVQRRPRPV